MCVEDHEYLGRIFFSEPSIASVPASMWRFISVSFFGNVCLISDIQDFFFWSYPIMNGIHVVRQCFPDEQDYLVMTSSWTRVQIDVRVLGPLSDP